MLARLTDTTELRTYVQSQRSAGLCIGFVPTMGYLHDGHLSLIEVAQRHADIVIASIFVNPTQFAPNEDLDSYPSDIEGDLAKLEQAGTNAVFLPSSTDIYDGGPSVSVSIPELSIQLCGASRPTHFSGVCQVVLKLFGLVQCDVAVFGQKDFQQLAIIRRLVRDLFLPIEVVAGDIIRESDGLAMSSRNVYLNESHRSQAVVLSQSLQAMLRAVRAGEHDVESLKAIGRSVIASVPDAELDYLEIVHRQTLRALNSNHSINDGHALVAVRFGQTRLIDNIALGLE